MVSKVVLLGLFVSGCRTTSGSDGGTCNDVTNLGGDVPMTMVSGDPPPLASISTNISSGTYTLVAYSAYSGPQGESGVGLTVAETIRIAPQDGGYAFDWVQTVDHGASNAANVVFRVTGPGELAPTVTCSPDTASAAPPYTYAFDQATLVLRYRTDTTVERTYVRTKS